MPTPSNELYREIPLTRGKVAIVDAANFEELSRYKWSARQCKKSYHWYALRNHKDENGNKYTVLMHRQVLGLVKGDKRIADHILREETLRNTKDNLRAVDYSQSNRNRGMMRSNTSGIPGVTKSGKRWRAYRYINGKTVFLGSGDSPEEAALFLRSVA